MKDLYFIALVFPEAISFKIQEIKNVFSERFGTKHGMSTMPHITIVPPLRMSESEVRGSKEFLSDSVKEFSPFDIHLDGFSHFKEKVIFVRVLQNEIIELIHQEVASYFSKAFGIGTQKFHPHITIANRDLKPDSFQEYFEFISNIKVDDKFTCNSISLLVHKSGKWEVDSTFLLEQTISP